jgi:hypothetical protein
MSSKPNDRAGEFTGDRSVADLGPEMAFKLGEIYGMAWALMMVRADREDSSTFTAQSRNRKRLELAAAEHGLQHSWQWINDGWGRFSFWKTPDYLSVTQS